MPIIASNLNSDVGDAYDISAKSLSVTIAPNIVLNGLEVGIKTKGSNGILNDGMINGFFAVALDGGDDFLYNSAAAIITGADAITGGGEANTIENFGVVFGSQYGLILTSDVGNVIRNHGSIIGSNAAIRTVSGSNLTVINRAEIQGDLQLMDTGVTVVNTGAIHGGITLGDGTNSVDSRGGTVDGEILGGAGVDTIRAGSDGEVMNGGAGHDNLYGGAGDDTFEFTSAGPSDFDYIHKFDVAHDTIQLTDVFFPPLVAGDTPSFSIGNAPTSATDYLYYKPSNGALFYDSNGSAAGGTVEKIAMLAPNLQLTASNFTVVPF